MFEENIYGESLIHKGAIESLGVGEENYYVHMKNTMFYVTCLQIKEHYTFVVLSAFWFVICLSRRDINRRLIMTFCLFGSDSNR